MGTILFHGSEAWKLAYPAAAVGILALGNVSNPERNADLDRIKSDLEEQVRGYATKGELRADPRLEAYRAYYKGFRKTYHVQMQLESIAFKGKSIPHVAALVEAMFIAELQDRLLTAGHDLDLVEPPVRVDVAQGTERFVRMNGQEQELKAGDMFIADAQGVLSTIIYGPASRAQILPGTRRVLFTVYAVPGIGGEAVRQHLQTIQSYVRLIAPESVTELFEVVGSG
ncbi:MAG: phenylalanine--tRNA ligase beta subunit-related protein [Anaerolineae bacterium]|jgi:DNA/RNA-binding domain of Phe-tRNA-synthetase-like protein